MGSHQVPQIGRVIVGYGEITRIHQRRTPIFFGNGWEASKSIETDDLTVSVEGLINPAKRAEQRHVVAPSRAKIHYYPLYIDDLAIDKVHKQNPGKILGVKEQAEIPQELVLGNGRRFKHLY